MSHSLEVTTWRDRPVVVKTAIDEAGGERLRREGSRLESMRHPGVVDLLEVGDDPVSLTCAWAGGRSLETHRPPIGPSVALLAAVAATLADLHAVGLVHGRIEASHVVVDADGRPRLCGMAGGEPGSPTPVPADDVAGLGRLIELLIGSGSEPEPIPEWRWGRRRWTGYQRRALQTLADQAADPHLDRRPSARDLAHAFVEVMPEARLAPVPHLVGPPIGSLLAATSAESTGSARSVDGETTSSATAGSEVAEAPTDGSNVQPGHAEVTPTAEGKEGLAADASEGRGTEEGDSSELFEWVAHEGCGLIDEPPPSSPGSDGPVDHDRPGLQSRSRPWPGSEPQPVSAFLGMRLAERIPAEGAPVGARRVDGLGEHGGDRPRRRREQQGTRRSAVVVVSTIVVLVVIGLTVAGYRGRSPRVPDVAKQSRPAKTASAGGATPAPRSVMPGGRGACPEVAGPSADVDGDGCAEGVVIEGSSIQAGAVKYQLGANGDQLAVGDWDCDGTATPALVRPGTGEVFVFARWATPAEPVSMAPTAVVAAGAKPDLERPSKCGPLRLRTVRGETTTVTATGGVDR